MTKQHPYMDIHMDIHIWVPRDPLGGIPWGGIPWGDRWDLGTDGTLGPMGPGPQGPWASRTPDHKTAASRYFLRGYFIDTRPGPGRARCRMPGYRAGPPFPPPRPQAQLPARRSLPLPPRAVRPGCRARCRLPGPVPDPRLPGRPSGIPVFWYSDIPNS